MAKKKLQLAKEPASVTTLTDIYRVTLNEDPLYLDLFVGAVGQKGLSNVQLGNLDLAKNVDGDIPNLLIGTNTFCNGKFLTVRTLVTDILGNSNDTFADFNLRGVAQGKYRYLLSKTVVSDGDSVLYDIKIFFYN